jgi:hypothetical protein
VTDVPPKPAESLRVKARLEREAARVALAAGDSAAAANFHLAAIADENMAAELDRRARVGHE